MHTKSFSRGFSLVELLIVVAVISILAAVATPAYYNHVLRVRQTDATNDLLDIKASQEMYFSQYGEYAVTPDDTFSDLLSFNINDVTYYIFTVSTSGQGYVALATGQVNTKFENNVIRMTDTEDPVQVSEPVGFKFSLLFD